MPEDIDCFGLIYHCTSSKKRRNISMAWVDYKKAFDSVSHAWLLEVLRIYKANGQVIDLLSRLMSKWKVMLRIRNGDQSIHTEFLRILRGIYQGDTLSPLWFCLTLNPLSLILESSKKGYSMHSIAGPVISHSFFMDDLKLYAKNERDLTTLLELTETFSGNISMSLGLDKCAMVHVHRGKIKTTAGVHVSNCDLIRSLSEDNGYKYLGVMELLQFKKNAKAEYEDKFKRRVKLLLRTYLSAGKLIKALNTWAMPVLIYTFGILKWSTTDLERIDRYVRTEMSLARKHHPKSSVVRMYLPRKLGGRGLISAQRMCRTQESKLRTYFLNNKSDVLKQLSLLDRNLTALNMASFQHQEPLTLQDMIEEWKGKPLHGRYFHSLNEETINQEYSTKWLVRGILFPETEGFLLAIQEQVEATLAYRKYICGESISDICRLCNETTESLQHLTTGCGVLAGTEYLRRHNHVAAIVHQAIAKSFGLLEIVLPYYQYHPLSVLSTQHVRLYWDQQIITDHKIVHNKPDILLLNLRRKSALIIDIAIPADDNVQHSISANICRYTELLQVN